MDTRYDPESWLKRAEEANARLWQAMSEMYDFADRALILVNDKGVMSIQTLSIEIPDLNKVAQRIRK